MRVRFRLRLDVSIMLHYSFFLSSIFYNLLSDLIDSYYVWSILVHWSMVSDHHFFFLFLSRFRSNNANSLLIVGGPDPSQNFRLATAIDTASKANVPKKTIEAAIKRGSGTGTSSSGPVEMALYEGIGPGATAFVIESLTDNKHRTVGVIKAAFTKCGGVLGPAAFLFQKRGAVRVGLPEGVQSVDEVLDGLIEMGAEDIEELTSSAEEDEPATSAGDAASAGGESEEGGVQVAVYTSVQDTAKVAQSLKASGYTIHDLGIEYAPNPDTVVTSLDESQKQAYEKLCGMLEDIDDVVEVYTNLRL